MNPPPRDPLRGPDHRHLPPLRDNGHGGRTELVAGQVDDACRRVGFIQIVGHGISADVVGGLTGAMDEFFALPLGDKKSYRVQGANRGYSPPKSESLSLSLGVESASRMNDFFEAFNVGVEARSFPPNWPSPNPTTASTCGPPSTGSSPPRAAVLRRASRVART